MSHLDEIISGATDESVKTSNLLRQVQIASHYLGAEEIRSWAQRELRGYGSDDPLPDYRAARPTPVMGTWVAMNYKATDRLDMGALPDEVSWAFEVDLRQSLAELEQLSGGDQDAQISWPANLVVLYNQAAQKGLVAHMQGANLVFAHRTLTRGMLIGVIDAVRNTALEFALSLQSADREAGSRDGPTIQSPSVREAVLHVTNHIYGDGVNIAQGSGMSQNLTVTKGDIAQFVSALAEILEDERAIGEVVTVVTSDEPADAKRSKLKKLGTAIGSGAVAIAAGVTSEVAADRLIHLAGQYLGW
ncbi:hypothetical protein NQ152_09855 [Microbacterium sp. zg.B48]|uniref:AbiTii domain-containing protein n=1 Tax=Microbacterium sp. zg.B48 TaxID=2969408 RepID=UPI00214B135E|nr:hypothetical protein [Microbacterium sp. zg.B48]MCR2763810.1 hypothetical protein [Microbacterium sp. zg.B48]